MKSFSKYCLTAAATASLWLFAACFTGIESTPKITADKIDRTQVAEQPEHEFISGIAGEPPAQWKPGKTFVITDPRISIIFDPGAPEMAVGDTLRYQSTTKKISIIGESLAQLRFSNASGIDAVYTTELSTDALTSKKSLEIPFTVEQSIVDEVRTRLQGRQLYMLTDMWYDASGQSFSGRKFVPAKVERVLTGNTVYPIRFIMREKESGNLFDIFMSIGSDLKAPRAFHKLFSLTDPRLRYPGITDEVWANIISGKVSIGMSLNECRLALGAPATVKRRPNNSVLYEIWNYDNGIYLLFEDGILKDFLR